jgi:tetratricopeptide (TPR) repeat protein
MRGVTRIGAASIIFYFLMGVLFILNTLLYLMEPSSYDIPVIFLYLITFITGLFLIKACFNKTLYSLVIIGVLVVMWVLVFVQPFSSDVDKTILYVEIGSITLIVILVLIIMLKLWDNMEKEIETYDKVLKLNPSDSTTLNNKGVQLVRQTKYLEAIKCFDKVLEIDPGDAVTSHNRNLVKEKLEIRKFSDYLKEYPKLEFTEKNGKKIIKIKNK